jgi:hypothetical protein
MFLITLDAISVWLQSKHPRVIRSDKPITSVYPVKSQKVTSALSLDVSYW